MSTINKFEKVNILRKEFLELDLNHDDFLSKDELFESLDKKANGQFDRDVGTQLYEKMDKDYDGRVTVDEFINVFLEAEDVLNMKIRDLRSMIEDQHRQRNESFMKLEEIKHSENLNNFGICQNSLLNASAIQINDINAQDFNAYYVIFECNEQSDKSGIHYFGDNSVDFSTSFLILNGMEDLNVSLIVVNTNDQNEEKVGQLTIPLNRLNDQLKHEEWFDLYDANGSLISMKIFMNLQWIYSKSKYLRELITKFDANIQYQENDLVDYETDLAHLYQPFKGLLNIYKAQMSKSIKENKIIIPENSQINVPMEPGENKQKVIQSFFNTKKNLMRMSIVMISSYLFLSLLACWDRSVFLDLCVVFMFLGFSYLKRIDAQILKFAAGIVFFSFVLDFPWLVIYTENWWNATDQYGPDNSEEMYLRRFVVVISYFLISIKVGVIILFYLLTVKYDIIKETQVVIVKK